MGASGWGRLCLAGLAATALGACSASGAEAAGRLDKFQPGAVTHRSVLVRGSLQAVGGPAGNQAEPLNGEIQFFRHGRLIRHVRANSDGGFSAYLKAGRYAVRGSSPTYDSGHAVCRADHELVARSGRTNHVTVSCQTP